MKEQYKETKSFAAEGVTYNLGMAKDFDDLKLAKMLREFCSLQTRQKIHKNTKLFWKHVKLAFPL